MSDILEAVPSFDATLSLVSGTLSSWFPLPFRILVLITSGILGWATNLHVLHLLSIDTSLILDIRTHDGVAGSSGNDAVGAGPSNHLHPSRLYPQVYQLAAFTAGWTIICWTAFQILAGGEGDAPTGRAIAAFSWVVALILLVAPWDRLKKQQRMMFLRSLRRITLDTIFRPVPFCDVILADILTSFAKVIGDLWVCVCLFLGFNEDPTSPGGLKSMGVPFMIALPYMFRFRQCISEYVNTPAGNSHPQQHPGPGLGHYHHVHQPSIFLAPTIASSTPASPKIRALFNAAKYATAFPVILFSALQGKFGDLHDHPGSDTISVSPSPLGNTYLTPTFLFRIWVLSVFINSLYSFWWDITNDWGLHFLLPSRYSASRASNPTILRRTLLLPDRMIYYLIMFLDLILRFTWSLKLSSHLHSIGEMEFGIFILEGLEILRRWFWVFGRLEWEAVRKGGDALEERVRLTGDFGHGIHGTPPNSAVGSGLGVPTHPRSGSLSGTAMDRRISANQRKHHLQDSNRAEDLDSDDDGEVGLGRPNLLVEIPRLITTAPTPSVGTTKDYF